jgi:hypothetical protein
MCGADLSDIDLEISSGTEGNKRKKNGQDKGQDMSNEKKP